MKSQTMTRNRRLATVTLILISLTCSLTLMQSIGSWRAKAAPVFEVTTTDDSGDDDKPTPGSLRQAILDANADPGPNLIDFQIPGAGVQTISPPTPLPAITDPVTIDGYTQPGAQANTLAVGNNAVLLIELDGTNSGTGFGTDGLRIQAGQSTIRGLVINRFARAGVRIELFNPGGNVIEGCFIGIDPTGSIAKPNFWGVAIEQSDNNTIGGTTPAARNVISGNNTPGGNDGDGIVIDGNHNVNPPTGVGNVVQGNYIGINAAGSVALGNHGSGLDLNDTNKTTIGGTVAGARNVISGNQISGIDAFGANQTFIEGNFIGTDAMGTAKIKNTASGVILYDSAECSIGGTAAGAGNVISGNGDAGVTLSGDGTQKVAVQGNRIGTDVSGNNAIGNLRGVLFDQLSPSNNTIGGATSSARNIISGNGDQGIRVGNSSGSNPSNNLIQGNYVGTNTAGTLAVPNGQGGVQVAFGAGTKVGGAAAGEGNLISGNLGVGIGIGGATATVVQGNIVGADVTGANALGNKNCGMAIESANNIVGGTIGSAGNIIAFNGCGISIIGATATGNNISGNSISSNFFAGNPNAQWLGIELSGDGVTQNDNGDGDSGPNNLQNFPVLTSAGSSNGSTTITGTLNSEANKQYRLEFFASAQCDPSGFGEGQIFLGATNVTTVGNNASFNVTLPVTVQPGSVVTATATDPGGNTSEFSQCFLLGSVSGNSSLQFSAPTYSVNENGGQATITVTRTGGNAGVVSVGYTTTFAGTATPGSDFTATSGTLTWPAGDLTSKTFNVSIVDDSLDENDETIGLSLSNPTGGAVLGNQSTALATIANSGDAQPTISISDVSVAEGNSGTTPAVFNVTLSAPSGKTVSVFFHTVAGTATTLVDYQQINGSFVNFNPGEVSKPITASVFGDTTFEPDETFTMALFNPINGTLNKSQGAGTILNDDNTPAPATVQFSQAGFATTEDSGTVTLTVTRSGDTSSATTVDYQTTDTDTFSVSCAAKQGAAFGRCDFATTVGTLSFAAGQTSKTFTVPVIDDSYAEGGETFNVVLSSPSGANLGAPSTAVVTINDNEGSSDGPNPVFNTSFFVRQHYLDFLGREPEPGEPWSGVLNGCSDPGNTDPSSPAAGCDRITVSGAFFGSPEFKDKGIYIIDFYRVALNRLPQYTEFSVDLASITGATAAEANAKRATFANNFVQRAEFTSIYNGSNTSFVNGLMAGMLGNSYNLTSITTFDPLNPNGPTKMTLTNTDLINALNSSTLTRAQVLRAIVQSDEISQNLESVNAFVASQYYGYLRRTPDTNGYNGWVNYMKSHPTDFRTMVNGFLNSAEYKLRFGP